MGARSIVVDDGGRAFKRHAVRVSTGEQVSWLVAELDGIRAYFKGDEVVLTREDLYP